MKSTEVQTLHQVPNCYVLEYMHVSGGKRYEICNNHSKLKESHQYSLEAFLQVMQIMM